MKPGDQVEVRIADCWNRVRVSRIGEITGFVYFYVGGWEACVDPADCRPLRRGKVPPEHRPLSGGILRW